MPLERRCIQSLGDVDRLAYRNCDPRHGHGDHKPIPLDLPGVRSGVCHRNNGPLRQLGQQDGSRFEFPGWSAGPIRCDDRRHMVACQRQVVIAQRPRTRMRGGAANDFAAHAAHEHGGNLTVHRGADQEAELDAEGPLLSQMLDAEQLMLVPVHRYEGGCPLARARNVLCAGDVDHTCPAPHQVQQ